VTETPGPRDRDPSEWGWRAAGRGELEAAGFRVGSRDEALEREGALRCGKGGRAEGGRYAGHEDLAKGGAQGRRVPSGHEPARARPDVVLRSLGSCCDDPAPDGHGIEYGELPRGPVGTAEWNDQSGRSLQEGEELLPVNRRQQVQRAARRKRGGAEYPNLGVEAVGCRGERVPVALLTPSRQEIAAGWRRCLSPGSDSEWYEREAIAVEPECHCGFQTASREEENAVGVTRAAQEEALTKPVSLGLEKGVEEHETRPAPACEEAHCRARKRLPGDYRPALRAPECPERERQVRGPGAEAVARDAHEPSERGGAENLGLDGRGRAGDVEVGVLAVRPVRQPERAVTHVRVRYSTDPRATGSWESARYGRAVAASAAEALGILRPLSRRTEAAA